MSTISKLEQDITEKLVQLELLKQQEAEFNALEPEVRFAIQLHEICCKSNHTDRCGWYYEFNKHTHDWNGYDHLKWLKISQQVLIELKKLNINIDQFLKILTLIEKT